MKNAWATKSHERAALSATLFRLAMLLLSISWVGGLHAQAVNARVTSAGAPQTKPQAMAQTPVAKAPEAIQAEDYVIGPDDLLTIYILDVPELSRDYRVSATGNITFPVLSAPLNASGLTLAQFSERLSQELKTQGLVSDPHVTISVSQSSLHSVAITGAVRQPQIYPVLSRSTLLDVISQAGGLADDAGGTAIVRRGDIGARASQLAEGTTHPETAPVGSTIKVDLKRLIESGDSSLNVNVYPGDRITVARAGIIYVVGAVNKPGGFTMASSTHGMTVLQAIALAEDTKTTAVRKQTVIIRNDPQAPEGRRQIPVDLKAILRGKGEDPVLQAEDILFVPDSAGKRAFNRGIESVLQATTGIVIYSARF